MSRHSWSDSEMIETLKIARLPQVKWTNAITALTKLIQRSDPEMDAERVRAAVNAAANAIGGAPDAFPKASARLRKLLKDGN